MKAILLFIELRFSLEHSQKELEALAARLPSGCRRVMHADKTIALTIPPYDALPVIHAKLRSALVAFKNYRFFGLSGESFCKDGSMDPVEDWMNENARVSISRGERSQSQNVALPQGLKPRSKITVDNLVSRTIGEEGLSLWPKKDGAE